MSLRNGGAFQLMARSVRIALNRRIYEQRDSGAADDFSYDPRNELTGFNQNGTLNANGTVSAAYNVSVTYDANGNRIHAFDGNNAHYNTAPNNQYSSDWTGALNYDDNANLISRWWWTFTYDAQNRMTRLEHAGTSQVIIYKYDALNRRIAQSSNGVVTGYVFDNWNRIEERPTDGRQAHCYLFGGAVNEVVVSFGPGYPNYWYFQDGRGNTSHLADNDHVLLERYTYSLDGRVSYFDGDGNSRTTSSVENRFLFAGAILLPETMLYDMRNRIYYPRWGRFLQTDPLGMQIQGAKLTPEQKAFYSPGGTAPEAFSSSELNLYRYCHNDPVNHTDPYGLDRYKDGDTKSFSELGKGFDQAPWEIKAAFYAQGALLTLPAGGLTALAGRTALMARVAVPAAAVANQLSPHANKLNHIFGKTGHNLGGLVKQFGSQEKAFQAIEQAAQSAVKSQGLTGKFEVTVKVGNETVKVTGKVIDEAARVGTAYKPR